MSSEIRGTLAVPDDPKAFPRTMWLKSKHGFIYECTVIGETSRSWTGYKWRPGKMSKKDHAVVTETEYAEWEWAKLHQCKIADYIKRGAPSAPVLRQIAQLIGYTG
jgi:hypothetical protein